MSNNRNMRTLQRLRADLEGHNVQALAALAGVNAKTIYRIRHSPDYMPGADKVERISAALDRLAKMARVITPTEPAHG